MKLFNKSFVSLRAAHYALLRIHVQPLHLKLLAEMQHLEIFRPLMLKLYLDIRH